MKSKLLETIQLVINTVEEEENTFLTIYYLLKANGKIPEEVDKPVQHGRWCISSDGYYPYCSICGKEPPGREMSKFCPNCGTVMDEKLNI